MGPAQPEKENVVIKMVDTGVVTDTTPAPTKVTTKEATMGTQTDTPITPAAAAAAMPVMPTPPTILDQLSWNGFRLSPAQGREARNAIAKTNKIH